MNTKIKMNVLVFVFLMLPLVAVAEGLDGVYSKTNEVSSEALRQPPSEDSTASDGSHTMTSNRPYFIRSLYEWIVDNKLTPHILVDVSKGGVDVPSSFVEDDRIILNISPSAARNLELGNKLITFNARFNGTPTDLIIPVANVLAVYAHENGQGMMFAE